LIGTGGWSYFKIPGQDSLKSYSQIYNFVEVNSTFYNIIPFNAVKSWRKRVPPNFEFSVRLNRIVSHKYKMEPQEEAFKLFDYTKLLCRILGSEIIVIETPENIEYSDRKISSLTDFFNSLNLGSTRLAWEIRQRHKQLPKALIDLLQEQNIMHIVDISREEPSYKSDYLYTRLFGKGEHNIYQFTDDELLKVYNNTRKRKYHKIAFTFHGIRMYKDAARFQTYIKTKNFPPVTKYRGLQSLRAILSEDTRFPISKDELIKHQGWKLMDMTTEQRILASELLLKLPDQIYNNVDQIILCLSNEKLKNLFV